MMSGLNIDPEKGGRYKKTIACHMVLWLPSTPPQELEGGAPMCPNILVFQSMVKFFNPSGHTLFMFL